MSYQIIDEKYVKMRHESVMPQNPTEQSLENALVELGIDREDLEFSTAINPNNTRYIRYRYWRPLPISNHDFAELPLYENFLEEDDCGNLYSYEIL
jgi:hypothetical protein